jgi:hypothetical protein
MLGLAKNFGGVAAGQISIRALARIQPAIPLIDTLEYTGAEFLEST